MSRQNKRLRLALGITLLKWNSTMLTLDANYPKDPDPKNWRTINGSKVHLTKGKIDGGAGGKFTGKKWRGKQHHQFVPAPNKMYSPTPGKQFSKAAQGHLDKLDQILKQSAKGKGKPSYYQEKIDKEEKALSALEKIDQLYEQKHGVATAKPSPTPAPIQKAPQIIKGKVFDVLPRRQQNQINDLKMAIICDDSKKEDALIKEISTEYGIDDAVIRSLCYKRANLDINTDEFRDKLSEQIADGTWQKSQKEIAKIQKITKSQKADFTKMSDDDIAEVVKIAINTPLPVGLNEDDPTQRLVYAAGWNDLPEIKTKSEVEAMAKNSIMLYRAVKSVGDATANEIMDLTRQCPVFKTSGNGERWYGGGMYMADSLNGARSYGRGKSCNVMGAALNKKAKMTSASNLNSLEGVRWITTHPKAAKAIGLKVIGSNIAPDSKSNFSFEDSRTMLALAMGYNIVYNPGVNYYTILDRSALTTSNYNYVMD